MAQVNSFRALFVFLLAALIGVQLVLRPKLERIIAPHDAAINNVAGPDDASADSLDKTNPAGVINSGASDEGEGAVGIRTSAKSSLEEDKLPLSKVSEEQIPQISRTEVDDVYFSKSPDERFSMIQAEIQEFSRTPLTCDTTYVLAGMWCDSNPGNGMRTMLKGFLLAFILNRMPFVATHRKTDCAAFLDFKRPELFVDYHHQRRNLPGDCPGRSQSDQSVTDATDYKCAPQWNATVLILNEGLSRDSLQMADLQFNPNMNSAQLARVRRVVDMGTYTTIGLLMDAFLDISTKVKDELHGDYFPGDAIMSKLKDDSVLKIGIHVRHLPFIVRDEGGPHNIEKRALKCLGSSAQVFQPKIESYTGGCLILVATDMNASRDTLLKNVNNLGIKCSTFMISRTRQNNLAWGGQSFSDWESRDPKNDKRGVLEAYLDFYVLSEYSQFIVFATGSTFSQLIAYRNARRRDVLQNVEFASASCKEEYFPYRCCHTRKRFDEITTITRGAKVRCPR